MCGRFHRRKSFGEAASEDTELLGGDLQLPGLSSLDLQAAHNGQLTGEAARYRT